MADDTIENRALVQTGVVTGWHLIVTTVTITVAFGIAFWTLLEDVRTYYLTIREHTEFVTRFNADIARLDREQSSQNKKLEGKIDTRESEKQAQLMNDALNQRLRDMQNQIDRLSLREDERHLRPHGRENTGSEK